MLQPPTYIIVTTTEPIQYLTEGRDWSLDATDAERMAWPDVVRVLESLPQGYPATLLPA